MTRALVVTPTLGAGPTGVCAFPMDEGTVGRDDELDTASVPERMASSLRGCSAPLYLRYDQSS